MKIFYIIAALLFIAACNSTADVTEKTENLIENEAVETESLAVETKKTTADLLIGTWEFEDPKIKVIQIITYNEDGTYAMKMGEMDITGTWELDSNVLITKSRPDAEGQKKTITQIDEKSLTTFWEPKGGVGRELVYQRK